MSRLGMGLGLNNYRYAGGFNGLLDELGIAENAVFIFSPYKRLVKNYTGMAVQVRRTSDYTYRDFGFDNNGDLKVQEMLDWVGAGNDGLIRIVYNQANSNYNISQESTANEPKIIESGVFLEDGLKFDGINDVMFGDNYTASSIEDEPITIYTNSKTNEAVTGYVYCNNLNASSNASYSHLNNSNFATFYWNGTIVVPSVSQPTIDTRKVLQVWNDKLSNGFSVIYNSVHNDLTFSSSITYLENAKHHIGARGSFSLYFKGNIKTVVVFDSNEYDNYSNLVNGGI